MSAINNTIGSQANFHARKTQLVLFDCSEYVGAINVKMDGVPLYRNYNEKC